VNYASTTYEMYFLLTTSEYYWNSVVFTAPNLSVEFDLAAGAITLARATYGSIWNFWLFEANNAAASTYYVGQNPDNLVLVGTRGGAGALHRATLINNGAVAPIIRIYTATTTNVYTVNADANGIVTINSPTGGMGQFKGALYGTTEKKYVQVICVGIAPMYYTTWALNLDDGVSNGWVISCYTGIAQCEASIADAYTALTSTE